MADPTAARQHSHRFSDAALDAFLDTLKRRRVPTHRGLWREISQVSAIVTVATTATECVQKWNDMMRLAAEPLEQVSTCQFLPAKLIKLKKKQLSALDKAKAMGPDNMKTCALERAMPLSKLFLYSYNWHLTANVENCPDEFLTKQVVTDRMEVSQSPPEIEAFEGDSINMQCSYEEDQMIESIQVEWTKDSVPVLNATITSAATNPAYINRLSHAMNKTNSKLTIENIIQDDAGLYRCNVFVEIPAPVRRGLGNGTKLSVQSKLNFQALVDISGRLAAALKILIFGVAVFLTFIVTRHYVLKSQNRPAEGK
uniref:uncharacterized protein n=1 Tax=Pristiophorus japonicus TaxID=55135 RepID=UPI00398E4029